ncbi:MAG: SPOR domain-containing protein [Pseudomonadota bacterium]
MGLFSFLSKNKQETVDEDGAYHSRADDEALSARAKSKRAASNGEGAPKRGKASKAADDPILPEKKRARRRLVGAVALALAVAVGLPMLLDPEPKPMPADIAIQIPSKDKPAPLPVPAAAPPVASTPAVKAADALDAREEIVDPAKPAPKAPPAKDALAIAEVKTGAKPEVPKVPAKPEAKAPEVKVAPKPAKVEEKAVVAAPNDARALAILEGKEADKPAAQKYMVQVGAFATQDKVNELQGKLKEAGIKSFTQKVPTQSGEKTRVRVGPFSSKEEADKTLAKLEKIGLKSTLVNN